jgi:hypothetical protein
MIKSGYKQSKTKSLAKGYLGDTPSEMKPTISFTDKELPELAKWKVGKTYNLSVEVKQVSLSQDNYDGKQQHRASFEVINVTPEEKD